MSVQIYRLLHRDDDGNASDDYSDVDLRASQHARARRAVGRSAGGLVPLRDLLVETFAEKSEAAHLQWQTSGNPADLRQARNWLNAMRTAMKDEDAA